jgi:hypothetical protein
MTGVAESCMAFGRCVDELGKEGRAISLEPANHISVGLSE